MNKLLLTILCLINLNCTAQKNNSIDKKNEIMQYFNDKTYKNWEIDTLYCTKAFPCTEDNMYYKQGNERIQITKNENEIQVKQSNTVNPIITIMGYWTNNTIKYYRKTFYKVDIEESKNYDENGKIIKKIDEEKDYNFKVSQLVDLIKKVYDVDLMIKLSEESELGYLVRKRIEKDTKIKIYEVYFLFRTEGSGGIKVVVDGQTGVILYEQGSLTKEGLPHSNTPQPTYEDFQKKQAIEQSKKPALGTLFKGSAPDGTYQIYKGIAYTKTEWEAFVKTQPWWFKLG